MRRKFLLVIVSILALVSFQKVEAASKTEYISTFLATIKYTPKGDFEVDNMDNRYYSQVYEVDVNNAEIIDYTVQELNNLPEGSFVADVNTGNKRETFDRKALKFKIMVPAEKVTQDFLGKIKVCMNFYGFMHTTTNSGEIVVDKVRSENEQIKILDNRHSSLNINFINSDTQEGIEEVEAEIIDTVYGDSKDMKSNDNGQMSIDKIGEGTAVVNIKRFPIDCYTKEWSYSIPIGYGENAEYNILLENQKGNLKIIDNIENAVFEIYDMRGELVRKIYKR